MDEMSCATGICVAFILFDFAVFTPCCWNDVCCDDPTPFLCFGTARGRKIQNTIVVGDPAAVGASVVAHLSCLVLIAKCRLKEL